MSRLRLPFALVLALIAASSCGAPVPPQPVSGEEAARTRGELDDRSFRQFEPSVDASPRKGAILDSFGAIAIWAQYAEDGDAVSEREKSSDNYRIERRSSSEIVL